MRRCRPSRLTASLYPVRAYIPVRAALFGFVFRFRPSARGCQVRRAILLHSHTATFRFHNFSARISSLLIWFGIENSPLHVLSAVLFLSPWCAHSRECAQRSRNHLSVKYGHEMLLSIYFYRSINSVLSSECQLGLVGWRERFGLQHWLFLCKNMAVHEKWRRGLISKSEKFRNGIWFLYFIQKAEEGNLSWDEWRGGR